MSEAIWVIIFTTWVLAQIVMKVVKEIRTNDNYHNQFISKVIGHICWGILTIWILYQAGLYKVL